MNRGVAVFRARSDVLASLVQEPQDGPGASVFDGAHVWAGGYIWGRDYFEALFC